MPLRPPLDIALRSPLSHTLDAAVSVSLEASAISETDADSYTFSAQALGTASTGRKILVGVLVRHSTDFAITSLSVAGITAHDVATAVLETGTRLAFWLAPVPAGTSGDVIVNLDTAVARCAVGVWAVNNLLRLSAFASASATTAASNTWSVTLNVPAGGAGIAMAYNGAVGAFTWGGLTERFDTAFSTVAQVSGAHSQLEGAQSALSVTAQVASANDTGGLLAISLR